MPTTTIPVKRETWARLRSYKVGGATYDDVLRGVLRLGGRAQASEAVTVGPDPHQSLRGARAGPPAAGRSGALRGGFRAAGEESEAPARPRREAPPRNEGAWRLPVGSYRGSTRRRKGSCASRGSGTGRTSAVSESACLHQGLSIGVRTRFPPPPGAVVVLQIPDRRRCSRRTMGGETAPRSRHRPWLMPQRRGNTRPNPHGDAVSSVQSP